MSAADHVTQRRPEWVPTDPLAPPGLETALPLGSTWDGRYRIERALGEGGMGTVVLARDLANDERPVALKVLHARCREFATAWFMREYAIQRMVRHPAIARALALGFDLSEGEEVPYFAMPLLPGVPLAEVMTTPQPLAAIWRWTLDILEALDAIHRAGFLHRDVKPGNILVDEEAADGPSARLIDFGIATGLADEPEDFFVGTPAYSAPERIECQTPFDVRSDLYSLGLVLYELIEGDPPWPGSGPDELLQQRLVEPAPPITHPECPEGVRALVAALLAREPERRPASAAIVIDELRAALGLHGPIEGARAFTERLSGLMPAGAAYRAALAADAPFVVVEAPEHDDAADVLDELGDRAALSGVRVVRVRFTGRTETPLWELEGALEILRRLRARGSENASELRGMAGAATLLTRLERPTMLMIEGLEHADSAVLATLEYALTGARNRMLSVVASMAAEVRPRAREHLASLLRKRFVEHLRLEPMTLEETHDLVARALAPTVLPEEVLTALHEEAGGHPRRVRELLVTAFERGVLVRRRDGYLWRDPGTTIVESGLGAGGVASAARPAALAPLLIEAAEQAAAHGDTGGAMSLAERAIALVRADDGADDELASWRLEVFAGALALAEAHGSRARIMRAADELLTVAVEHAHLASIERALIVRIDRAEATWDVAGVSADVDRLILYRASCGAPEPAGLAAWVGALDAALRGEVADALRACSEGIDACEARLAGELEEASRALIRWVAHRLLDLRAELAVLASERGFARQALAAYDASVEARVATSASDTEHAALRLEQALLHSLWLRRLGDLGAARAALAAVAVRAGAEAHAGLALAIAECELALGSCELAIEHAERAIQRARHDKDAVVAFGAEGVLAEAWARKGEPRRQRERLERLVHLPPPQILPQAVARVRLRWLQVRLALGEHEAVAADAIELAREAARSADLGAAGRAAFLAAQACLRLQRPLQALRQAEWVARIARLDTHDGPPQHAAEWLLASVHFQLKWFKSARALSGRAMESLRSTVHRGLGESERTRWLKSGDSFLVGLVP